MRISKLWLPFVLAIAGIAIFVYFYWWKIPSQKTPPSQEETETFLKSRAEIRSQQKYYERLIPIYEKIIEQDPKNEEAKKELTNIRDRLQKLR